jgi:hypothetical protein
VSCPKRTRRYYVFGVTVHAGGRHDEVAPKATIIEINHADIAMMPHEILKEHGIATIKHDYTDSTGRWLYVHDYDYRDAVKTLKAYEQ